MSLIALIGPAGACVPEVAAALSHDLGIPCAITDEVIEQIAATTPSDISLDQGEDTLRELEREVSLALLRDVTASSERILALGSGCLGNSLSDGYFLPVREALAELAQAGALVVWLTGDLTTLVKRTGLGGPRMAAVASPRKIFYNQLAAREPVYLSASTTSIDTSGLDLEAVVSRVTAVVTAQ